MKTAKKSFIIGLTIASFAPAVLRSGEKRCDIVVGKPAPNFIGTDIHGKKIELVDFKGKIVILDINKLGRIKISEEERIKLREFYNEHREQGLEIIRVAFKSGFIPLPKSFVENRARASLSKRKEDWIVIIDWKGTIKKLYGVDDPPLVLVIDRAGIIRHIRKKELIADDSLQKIVLELLGE